MSQFYIKYIDGQMYGPYSESEIRNFRLSEYTMVLKIGTDTWRELYYFNLPPLSEEEKAAYIGAHSPYDRPYKRKDIYRHKSYKTAITVTVMIIIAASVIITTYFLLQHINDNRNKVQYHNDAITVQTHNQTQIIVHE